MLLGLQFHPFGATFHGNAFDTLLAVVQACELAELDSVWMADRFMFTDDDNPEREVPVLECFVALGAIAAHQNRRTGRRGAVQEPGATGEAVCDAGCG